MKSRIVDVSATTTATPEAVYAVLVDRSTWPDWSPMESTELHRPADGTDPDGVGAVWQQKMGRTTGFDTLIELVPGERFVYTNAGTPTRDYVGHVELTSEDGGCRIRWWSQFAPKYPGTGGMLERGFARMLQRCVDGLAEYAGRNG